MPSNDGGPPPTDQPSPPQSLPPIRPQSWPSQASPATTRVSQPSQPTHQLWSPSLPSQAVGVAGNLTAGCTPRLGLPLGMPMPLHQQTTSLGMGLSGQPVGSIGSGWQGGVVPSWAPHRVSVGPPHSATTAPSSPSASPRAPVMASAAPTPANSTGSEGVALTERPSCTQNSVRAAHAAHAKVLAQAAETEDFCREALGGEGGKGISGDSAVSPSDNSDDSVHSNSSSSRSLTVGDLAGSKPPVSQVVRDNDNAAGESGVDDLDDEDSDDEKVLRRDVPHYSRWTLPDLRAKAKIVARSQNARNMTFGDGANDVLCSISTAKRPQIADALIKLAAFREANGEKQDYRHWPPLTPEKVKRSNGKAKAFADPRKDVNTLSRIMALLGDPVMFSLYISYNRSGSRDAQDAKEVGCNHKFIKAMAAALIDVDWKNADGNPISVPIDHRHDKPPAPDDLIEAMEELDLVAPARLLRNSLPKDAKDEPDVKVLYPVIQKWLKASRVDHKDMREREDRSGGVGTDVIDDVKDEDDASQSGEASGDGVGDGGGGSSDGTVGGGGGGSSTGKFPGDGGRGSSGYIDKPLKDGIHTWCFCKGNLALMLFHDALQANANGDCQMMDVVIRPGKLGGKKDTDEASAHQSAVGQNVKSEGGRGAKKRRRSKKAQEKPGDVAPAWAEFSALARSMEERNSRAEQRELELREHDAMLERKGADPCTQVEKAAQAAEQTRKRIEDLPSQASSTVRDALNAVLAKREKKLKACIKKLDDGDSEDESEDQIGNESAGEPGDDR